MGDGWVAAATCSVSPKQTWWERHGTIETLLARAEKLSPAQDEDARREQIFGVQRRYFDVQIRRGREIAFVVVFGVLALGLAAGLVAGLTADTPPDTAESDFLVARIFIAGVCESSGHASVQTTMIYTHVINRGGLAVTSPLDFLTPESGSPVIKKPANNGKQSPG